MVLAEVVTMTGTQNGTDPRGGWRDVVVVGGGLAGLSGALVLVLVLARARARARRTVLVIDAGEPRNAPAALTQGFLTRDGTPPGELLEPDADVVLDEAFWEGMYRSSSHVWSGQPNSQLVTEAADLTPGTALDVGCGEGADAIWLAQRGWQVTAVDISATALRRGEAHAAQAGADVAGRITWLQADLTSDEASVRATYDLVTAQFVHVPSVRRETLHARLAAAVSPGGTLLVVGHHPSDLHAGAGRWSMPDVMFTADQVAAGLDPARWDVEHTDSRPRTVTDARGGGTTVHDAVLTARRRLSA